MSAENPLRVFLSHTHHDKAVVRPLAAALQLLGANVWFDEWRIRPGDSIPGAIDAGLREFDVFMLAWSRHAANSMWVRTEMNAAIARIMATASLRLVPLRLDDEALPAIIGDLMYLDARHAAAATLAARVMGITEARELRMAYQAVLEQIGLDAEVTPFGSYICCPECGAERAILRGGSAIDERHGDVAWINCPECGWSVSGEV
ncbi:MAG: toll/interleukin-1 receptor domain-containing protein [Planctomycetes bacterium]|nr:toll/interleukin-1 receptor domain-containing protein [Planctomycetota bacterium]